MPFIFPSSCPYRLQVLMLSPDFDPVHLAGDGKKEKVERRRENGKRSGHGGKIRTIEKEWKEGKSMSLSSHILPLPI